MAKVVGEARISLYTHPLFPSEVFVVRWEDYGRRVGGIETAHAGPLSEHSIAAIRRDPWNWPENLPTYDLIPEHPIIERLATREIEEE